MTEWQPISTFPRDGETYLATNNCVEGGFSQVVYWERDRLAVQDVGISYDPAFFTHWMSIPKPPDGDGK